MHERDPRATTAVFLFAGAVGADAERHRAETEKWFARALSDPSHRDHAAARGAASAAGAGTGAPLPVAPSERVHMPPSYG